MENIIRIAEEAAAGHELKFYAAQDALKTLKTNWKAAAKAGEPDTIVEKDLNETAEVLLTAASNCRRARMQNSSVLERILYLLAEANQVNRVDAEGETEAEYICAHPEEGEEETILGFPDEENVSTKDLERAEITETGFRIGTTTYKIYATQLLVP